MDSCPAHAITEEKIVLLGKIVAALASLTRCKQVDSHSFTTKSAVCSPWAVQLHSGLNRGETLHPTLPSLTSRTAIVLGRPWSKLGWASSPEVKWYLMQQQWPSRAGGQISQKMPARSWIAALRVLPVECKEWALATKSNGFFFLSDHPTPLQIGLFLLWSGQSNNVLLEGPCPWLQEVSHAEW